MIRYCNKGLHQPHESSYEIAKPFMTAQIEQKWNKLIEEVLHD